MKLTGAECLPTLRRMAKKKSDAAAEVGRSPLRAGRPQTDYGAHGVTRTTQRPSPLVDTRVIYCGDNLEQPQKLPDAQ